jgi:eukaryotic-like serine/threonine-protein kinase
MELTLTRRTALLGSLSLAWAGRPSGTDALDAPSAIQSGTVPMFRGNPARTGEHPGPGPIGRLNPLWATRLGSTISSTPAVADGVVFVGSVGADTLAGGALHAVDSLTGEELWRLQTAMGDALFASPAVVEGTVYAGTYDGIVVAARAMTGAEIWRFQAEFAVFSSPAVSDGAVVFGDGSGRFYALDAATGEERWRFWTDEPFRRSSNASPAVADGMVFVVNSAQFAGELSSLHALEVETGEERWQFIPQEGGLLRSATGIVNGRVHVTTTDGFLYVLDVEDGAELWHYDGGSEIRTLPAVSEGVVFFVTVPATLHAVNVRSGQRLWSRQIASDAEIASSPTAAQGVIYMGDRAGILYAIETESGDELWQGRVRSILSSPVVLDGTVYFGGDDGALRALGGTLKRETPPLP